MTDVKSKATEKIDAVLNYLNNNRNLAYHYGYGLPRQYNKPKSIILTDQDLLNVLDKLERDKMVRMTKMGIGNGNSNSAEHYTISLDGEMLLQDGGYTQKLKDKRLKIEKEEQNLIASQRNERIISLASPWAAGGAIGLLIFEVLKSIFCIF